MLAVELAEEIAIIQKAVIDDMVFFSPDEAILQGMLDVSREIRLQFSAKDGASLPVKLY